MQAYRSLLQAPCGSRVGRRLSKKSNAIEHDHVRMHHSSLIQIVLRPLCNNAQGKQFSRTGLVLFLQVVFTPGHNDGHHNHKMLLNVADGTVHPEISCTAHSHTPHVEIEPHLLDLGASLPISEGGAVLQGSLTLHNPHNHAIEVLSVLGSSCSGFWIFNPLSSADPGICCARCIAQPDVFQHNTDTGLIPVTDSQAHAAHFQCYIFYHAS